VHGLQETGCVSVREGGCGGGQVGGSGVWPLLVFSDVFGLNLLC